MPIRPEDASWVAGADFDAADGSPGWYFFYDANGEILGSFHAKVSPAEVHDQWYATDKRPLHEVVDTVLTRDETLQVIARSAFSDEPGLFGGAPSATPGETMGGPTTRPPGVEPPVERPAPKSQRETPQRTRARSQPTDASRRGARAGASEPDMVGSRIATDRNQPIVVSADSYLGILAGAAEAVVEMAKEAALTAYDLAGTLSELLYDSYEHDYQSALLDALIDKDQALDDLLLESAVQAILGVGRAVEDVQRGDLAALSKSLTTTVGPSVLPGGSTLGFLRHAPNVPPGGGRAVARALDGAVDGRPATIPGPGGANRSAVSPTTNGARAQRSAAGATTGTPQGSGGGPGGGGPRGGGPGGRGPRGSGPGGGPGGGGPGGGGTPLGPRIPKWLEYARSRPKLVGSVSTLREIRQAFRTTTGRGRTFKATRAAAGELTVLEKLHASPLVRSIELLTPRNLLGSRMPDMRVTTTSGATRTVHVEVRTVTGSRGSQRTVRHGDGPGPSGHWEAASPERVRRAIQAKIKRGQISQQRPGVIAVVVDRPPADGVILKASDVALIEQALASKPHIVEVVVVVPGPNGRTIKRVGTRDSGLGLSAGNVLDSSGG